MSSGKDIRQLFDTKISGWKNRIFSGFYSAWHGDLYMYALQTITFNLFYLPGHIMQNRHVCQNPNRGHSLSILLLSYKEKFKNYKSSNLHTILSMKEITSDMALISLSIAELPLKYCT